MILFNTLQTNKMKTYCPFDKSFGPVGSKAGIIVFVTGVVMLYYAYSAVILLVIGAFFGFSNSGTYIDTGQKRVKFTNNLFGLIPIGKWIDIEPNMSIGVHQSVRVWRAFSWSNQVHDTADQDYRVVLNGVDKKEIIPLFRSEMLNLAQIEAEKLSQALGISRR